MAPKVNKSKAKPTARRNAIQRLQSQLNIDMVGAHNIHSIMDQSQVEVRRNAAQNVTTRASRRLNRQNQNEDAPQQDGAPSTLPDSSGQTRSITASDGTVVNPSLFEETVTITDDPSDAEITFNPQAATHRNKETTLGKYHACSM